MTEYDYSPGAYERYLATQNRIAHWAEDTRQHEHEFVSRPPPTGGFPQSEAGRESVVTVKPHRGPAPAEQYLKVNAKLAKMSPSGVPPPLPDVLPGRLYDKQQYGNGVPGEARSRSIAPGHAYNGGHRHYHQHGTRHRSHSPSYRTAWPGPPHPEYVAQRAIPPTGAYAPQQQRYQAAYGYPAPNGYGYHRQQLPQQQSAPVTYGQGGYGYSAQAPQGSAGYYRGPAPYQHGYQPPPPYTSGQTPAATAYQVYQNPNGFMRGSSSSLSPPQSQPPSVRSVGGGSLFKRILQSLTGRGRSSVATVDPTVDPTVGWGSSRRSKSAGPAMMMTEVPQSGTVVARRSSSRRPRTTHREVHPDSASSRHHRRRHHHREHDHNDQYDSGRDRSDREYVREKERERENVADGRSHRSSTRRGRSRRVRSVSPSRPSRNRER